MLQKLNLVKAHKAEYVTPLTPTLVHVGPALYLAVDGEGNPNGPGFEEAVGALYGVAYTIKMRKKREGTEYAVAPLEGLWWAADLTKVVPGKPDPSWRWTALIRTPDFIADEDLELAQAELEWKKKGGPALRCVRLERLEEGDCVQMLHVGPYATEPATGSAMHGFAAAQGRTLRGRHHEIYMSDPRRTPPERLKTILRQPVS